MEDLELQRELDQLGLTDTVIEPVDFENTRLRHAVKHRRSRRARFDPVLRGREVRSAVKENQLRKYVDKRHEMRQMGHDENIPSGYEAVGVIADLFHLSYEQAGYALSKLGPVQSVIGFAYFLCKRRDTSMHVGVQNVLDSSATSDEVQEYTSLIDSSRGYGIGLPEVIDAYLASPVQLQAQFDLVLQHHKKTETGLGDIVRLAWTKVALNVKRANEEETVTTNSTWEHLYDHGKRFGVPRRRSDIDEDYTKVFVPFSALQDAPKVADDAISFGLDSAISYGLIEHEGDSDEASRDIDTRMKRLIGKIDRALLND